MKILILGAGQVGSTVAQILSGEANDITVVDQNPRLLSAISEQSDIRTVTGLASHPGVLVQAGIQDADLVLAVTNSDEVNMIACQVAHTLFRTPTRLARLRSAGYISHPELFAPDAVPVNFIISPEQLVTTFISHLIATPGVLQILDFAGGKAQLVAVQAHRGGKLIGEALNSLPRQLPSVEARVVAIYRHGATIIPDGDTLIESGDEIFFLASPRHIDTLVSAFRRTDKPNRRIIVAGGGNIGERLAGKIERDYRVKLIELDHARCLRLAENLDRTMVLHGDAADAELLDQEDIGNTDVFCAVTNDDEANILSAMLARRLGARKVMSIINRSSYVDLAQGATVDIAISPAQITIGALLAHIRRGDVVAVHSLRRGAAEAIEIIAHGDSTTSQVVGQRIGDLPLPAGTSIGVIVRDDKLVFPHHDTVIESHDHVVLFIANKQMIGKVESLFRVAIGFL